MEQFLLTKPTSATGADSADQTESVVAENTNEVDAMDFEPTTTTTATTKDETVNFSVQQGPYASMYSFFKEDLFSGKPKSKAARPSSPKSPATKRRSPKK
eukprot:GFYU01018989.1.p1 GENE.GFYU01018989.1~~GFYU01018989.1.p1  ORF type:complete len:100 (-),score=15.97 GFYU01018989.1:61-360(-)